MDSSNSGSFQSSSGGAGDNDVDYDSRTTQSISSFFNPSTNFNPNLNHLLQQQQQPPPPQHHRPSFYTPSSPPSFSPNPLQDPASAWTRTIRPDQINLPDFAPYTINPNNPSTTADTQTKSGRGSDHQIGVAVKNPKKRTRASRRAPTTVLTTDTTNFRQMVQEFTGIPTAPFTNNAPFSRRLDLFAPAGSLRPSANKIQPQPPPFLNSAANIIVESNNTTTTTSAATTSSGNYQFGPSTINNFQKQPSSFLDLQNPMFSFQSLLQNSSVLPQQSNDLQKRWMSDQNGKVESFEGVVGNNQNIGGTKLNSGMENNNVLTGGGDQVQGNEGSWICPSN